MTQQKLNMLSKWLAMFLVPKLCKFYDISQNYREIFNWLSKFTKRQKNVNGFILIIFYKYKF